MYEFRLPDIGEGISEAVLTEWMVRVGDQVEEGEDLAAITTDKVDVELPSPRAGTIAELCWTPGDTINVGAVLVRIRTDGEETSVAEAQAPASPSKAAGGPSAPPAAASRPASGPASVVAAPSTRRLAAETGVDLTRLTGSGPEGQIRREDVELAVRDRSPPASRQDGDAARMEPIRDVRAAMGRRMSESVRTYAHSTLNFSASAQGAVSLLDRLSADAKRRGAPISVTALLLKCVSCALVRNPRFNATIDEVAGRFLFSDDVNISVAVAGERGLVVPVLRGVDKMSLTSVGRALQDLADRARTGGLTPSDTRGGTFTLSSTGALETARFTGTRPIINPPQTSILWVSRIREEACVRDGRIVAAPMVHCSLSFDHRYIDGAESIAFANDIGHYLENPELAIAE